MGRGGGGGGGVGGGGGCGLGKLLDLSAARLTSQAALHGPAGLGPTPCPALRGRDDLLADQLVPPADPTSPNPQDSLFRTGAFPAGRSTRG